MKTFKDLEEMKNKPSPPFDSQYVYFFMNLENDYIKSRISRIRTTLEDWDAEAREFIIYDLIKILKSGGMILDSDEINELTGLKINKSK